MEYTALAAAWRGQGISIMGLTPVFVRRDLSTPLRFARDDNSLRMSVMPSGVEASPPYHTVMTQLHLSERDQPLVEGILASLLPKTGDSPDQYY